MKQRRSVTIAENKAIDVEKGIYEVWITREIIDRSGDLVIAEGGRFENFRKNPVVQWAHLYNQPPIARALELNVIPGEGVKALFQFPAWGDFEMADTIHRLWRGGFINASSIGFDSITEEEMDAKNDNGFRVRPALKFLEWELLEFSLVPVPANQEALRRSLKYLMTPEQRRRVRRRIKERERSKLPSQLVEPVSPDSELLSSLTSLSQQIKSLQGAFNHGRSNQRAA
jgi:hypothetical protein